MTTDPMAEIRASFFSECEELLEALNDGLQLISDSADDADTINVVFRAVHSIKGGAGAFGLEQLVQFAHRFETVLEEARVGRLRMEGNTIKLLFQAADHLSDLVRACQDGVTLLGDAATTINESLDGLLSPAKQVEPASGEGIDFQPIGLTLNLDDDAQVQTNDPLSAQEAPDTDAAEPLRCFQITFAPEAELFETGNEPVHLLRALSDLGEMDSTCVSDDLPPLDELVPGTPYLHWEISLKTTTGHNEILSVFEFVECLCELDIQELPNRESDVSSPEPEPTLQPEHDPSRRPDAHPQNPPQNPDSQANSTAATPTKSVVRVDIDRIERLVNLVGELVINQAMLGQSLERSGVLPHSEAMNGFEEFQRLTRDIQDSVMMIRAQPVKSLFQRMSRIVRETSAAVDKDVQLCTIGDGTEVDKTVIERLADPLTHMMRNAVDHGLESAKERTANGKSAKGVVTLSASHRSGRVIIEIADDGGGINRPKVRQIAVEKGLISADAQLTDSEVDNLLFLPGFSTASVVSDLSGRGVGMDVVRAAIQSLGGRITISSEPGKGTTFTISLPLTLAVLDGMVIQVAGETLVLPLNLVVETLALSNASVQMVRPGRHVIKVRTGFVPIFDLGAALGYRGPATHFDECVVLLISQEGEATVALLIDTILDQRQVVIKGLDDSFGRAPGIAAATILGDGQIALILDPFDIVASAETSPPLSIPLPSALPQEMHA